MSHSLVREHGELMGLLHSRTVRVQIWVTRRPMRVCTGSARIRDGDAGGLAHLASVLINEYALADVALARSDFHAVFDGALRAGPAC